MSTKNIYCPPYETYNMITKPRIQTYDQWFASAIYYNDYKCDNTQCVSHGSYIKYFYNNIIQILKNNDMNITNEKEFKKEIATFIYRLSDENKECPL